MGMLLNWLIWLPIVGGMWVALVRPAKARYWAFGLSLLPVGLAALLWGTFRRGTAAFQFSVDAAWIDTFQIRYQLGVDGISMPLVVLTAMLTPLAMLAGWRAIREADQARYLGAFLIMEGLMIGVFAALDAILFYLFWEAMLIPMFLIIGIWGGERRIYAAIKFFLYTLAGSLLMLVALLYLRNQAGSFSLPDFHALPLALPAQIALFLAFFAAFAVKVPMFPVHTWLPDAHVEAPTGGSVILAAVMLKMGAYGFLRLNLPITPDASRYLADWMIGLSLIAIVYIALVALAQKDMKKLIAYSSISHMGFVTLGLFVFEPTALAGAAVQMISHGFISAALFLCVGVLYDRAHSRQIADYGGVATPMPKFAAFLVLFAMANAGLPGTSGFVGEFLVILGSFARNPWLAVIAATTLILGAAYTLYMVRRVLYGEVARDELNALEDVSRREEICLWLLAVAVLALGLWPQPLLEVMTPSLTELLNHLHQSKLP